MRFTIKEMCIVFRKSACTFGQVKTKMYLPESPYFKESLAGASRLVLMSVPVLSSNAAGLVFTNKVNDYEDVLLCDQGSTVPGPPR